MAERRQEGRISEPLMSQAPMNPTRDDQRDSMDNETVSSSRATANAARFCELTGNTHQFIREVNGRYFNAQNTLYFLPAGELFNFPPILPLCTPNSRGYAIDLSTRLPATL